MNNRTIRKLPFPKMSYFSLETVRKIRAIPDEDIEDYTPEEIAWMERAIKNLEYMIEVAKSVDLETENMIARRKQFESAVSKKRVGNEN